MATIRPIAFLISHDLVWRQAMLDRLFSAGWRVKEGESVKEVIRKQLRTKITLVLVDARFSEEWPIWLRELEQTPNLAEVKIVFLVGSKLLDLARELAVNSRVLLISSEHSSIRTIMEAIEQFMHNSSRL